MKQTNYKVIYSPVALDDLRNIYSYIAFILLVPDTAKAGEPYSQGDTVAGSVSRAQLCCGMGALEINGYANGSR